MFRSQFDTVFEELMIGSMALIEFEFTIQMSFLTIRAKGYFRISIIEEIVTESSPVRQTFESSLKQGLITMGKNTHSSTSHSPPKRQTL